ncbi:MAG: head GIN domain-containing protein [Pseudomonadota bacterium]
MKTISALTLVSSCLLATTAMAKDRSFDLDTIKGVDVSGASTVYITAGEEQSVVLSVDDEDKMDKIKVKVSDGVLYVEPKGYRTPSYTLTVSMRTIEEFDSSGSARGWIKNIDAERFSFDSSGSSRIALSGKCGELEIDISGSGRVGAKELACNEVGIDISGSGRATVHALKAIDADISGSGKVLVYGSPTRISQDVSGSGRIRMVGDDEETKSDKKSWN